MAPTASNQNNSEPYHFLKYTEDWVLYNFQQKRSTRHDSTAAHITAFSATAIVDFSSAEHLLTFLDTHSAHFVLIIGFQLQRSLSEADWKTFQDRLYGAKKKRRLWTTGEHAILVR